MITYENFFFRNKETFKTWKEAIAFAKDEMDYILTHEAVFSKRLIKMADEEYEDLVIASWSTEEQLQEDFANEGFGCTGLYEIKYIKEN